MLRSWVTSTRVVPVSRFISNISAITVSPVAWSRLPVGSSASSTSGSTTKARASATRCCSPPDKVRGVWFKREPRPTRSSMAVARARASARPSSSSGSITFSSALKWPSNWKLWNTKPSLRARRPARSSSSSAKMSSPSRRTVPLVG